MRREVEQDAGRGGEAAGLGEDPVRVAYRSTQVAGAAGEVRMTDPLVQACGCSWQELPGVRALLGRATAAVDVLQPLRPPLLAAHRPHCCVPGWTRRSREFRRWPHTWQSCRYEEVWGGEERVSG